MEKEIHFYSANGSDCKPMKYSITYCGEKIFFNNKKVCKTSNEFPDVICRDCIDLYLQDEDEGGRL